MGKGGGADSSGMYAAMASAQAAQLEYQLGEQQLQWAKDVWNQEQPLITEAEQTQIQYAQQQEAESQAQWDLYQQYYAPLEKQVATQVQDWASPQAMALATGEAEANTAEGVAAGINTAKEQLGNYGIRAGSPEYAGLYVGANTMGGAAEAGAGTMAAQNLRNQQLALEQGAAGQGLNVAGQSGSLGAQGAQAASGAAGTAQANLSTGSSAQTAPVNWFNSGAANMQVYTNAVNQYNQQQYQQEALGAQELGSAMGGFGDILGLISPIKIAAKGGPINKFANGGDTGLPPPPDGTPGGFVPPDSSPSGGQQVDDVPSLLTVGEFVMPKDVVDVKGTDFFYKLIDSTRKAAQTNSGRTDIGGEQTTGLPTGPPAFVSRPQGAMPQQPPVQSQPVPMPTGMPSMGVG